MCEFRNFAARFTFSVGSPADTYARGAERRATESRSTRPPGLICLRRGGGRLASRQAARFATLGSGKKGFGGGAVFFQLRFQGGYVRKRGLFSVEVHHGHFDLRTVEVLVAVEQMRLDTA